MVRECVLLVIAPLISSILFVINNLYSIKNNNLIIQMKMNQPSVPFFKGLPYLKMLILGSLFLWSFAACTESEIEIAPQLLQKNAAIARDNSGNSVQVWQRLGTSGSYNDIYAQRCDAQGIAQGNAFRVNTYTKHQQTNPAVAMNPKGNFVVVWQSFEQDGDGYGVYGQRYNAAGVAQDAEFQINTYTDYSQGMPNIAMNAAGSFIVAWQSFGQDGSKNGIFAQRYDAQGNRQKGEWQVNTQVEKDQFNPKVELNSTGDFGIIWQSDDSSEKYFNTFAKQYDLNGIALLKESKIGAPQMSRNLGFR
jgi:hypothetical protein